MITRKEAAAALLRRRAARRELGAYIEYTNPRYKTSEFSRVVCEALDKFIVDVFAGVRPILIFQAPPQHGKLIADDVPVLTADGWKLHGELKVGDRVLAPDGEFANIVAVSDKAPADVRVELTDGSVFYCHERHEWTLHSRDKKRELTLETSELLRARLHTGETGKRGSRYMYQLPKVRPVIGERKRVHKMPKVSRRVAIKSVAHDPRGKIGHCIQVDREDGLYLIGDNLTPTHNSEIVSRKLPAYLLGSYPDLRIGAASYSDELAGAMAQDVRRNLVNEQHQKLFPAPTTKKKYAIDRTGEFNAPGGEGSYLGVGVGAGLTGRPVDIGIIDDPVKNEKEALSPTIKEGHWNWYQSVFTTRLSENSGQIIMATSWAEDDLPGRICAAFDGDPRLTVLRFPALNEPDEAGYNPRLPGGPLVPELHSRGKLLETKGLLSDYWWSALYQQTPKALGGNVFKESGIQYYLPKDLPKKFDKVVASLDATFKDTDGTDYVVCQVWGKLGANSYLLDQTRGRLSFTATVEMVIKTKQTHPRIRQFYIEDKANGPAIIDALKGVISGLIPIEPDGSKLARAHAVTHVWEAGNVWLPHPDVAPWVKLLVGELTAFPAAANDDQVDAMTQALRQLYPLFERFKISRETVNRALGRKS